MSDLVCDVSAAKNRKGPCTLRVSPEVNGLVQAYAAKYGISSRRAAEHLIRVASETERDPPVDPLDIKIEAALRANDGNVTRAVNSLGLRSKKRVQDAAKRLGFRPSRAGRPVPANPTPREREAMLLSLRLGSQKDVAKRMGVTPQCVSYLLARGRARIAAWASNLSGPVTGQETESGE